MRTRTLRTTAVRSPSASRSVLGALMRQVKAALAPRTRRAKQARERLLGMDLDQRVREIGEW